MQTTDDTKTQDAENKDNIEDREYQYQQKERELEIEKRVLELKEKKLKEQEEELERRQRESFMSYIEPKPREYEKPPRRHVPTWVIVLIIVIVAVVLVSCTILSDTMKFILNSIEERS